jgi:hypothetical protein
MTISPLSCSFGEKKKRGSLEIKRNKDRRIFQWPISKKLLRKLVV